MRIQPIVEYKIVKVYDVDLLIFETDVIYFAEQFEKEYEYGVLGMYDAKRKRFIFWDGLRLSHRRVNLFLENNCTRDTYNSKSSACFKETKNEYTIGGYMRLSPFFKKLLVASGMPEEFLIETRRDSVSLLKKMKGKVIK